MARRDTAALAAMADPVRNKWFSYNWELPPPKRKSPSASTPGSISESNTSTEIHSATSTKSQARREAERLFAPGKSL